MAGRGLITNIDQILSRVTIADVLRANGVTPPKNEVKGNISCPIDPGAHKDGDKRGSFSVFNSADHGAGAACYCPVCNKGGNAIWLQSELSGEDFRDAAQTVAKLAGVEVQFEKEDKPDPNAMLKRVTSLAADYYQQQLLQSNEAKLYAKSRGFDGESAKRIGLGFAPNDWGAGLKQHLEASGISEAVAIRAGVLKQGVNSGKTYDPMNGRLIFPIRDEFGTTIAFGGRVLPGSDRETAAKYYNTEATPIFDKGQVLYGFDMARKAIGKENGLAYVFEGYMDVESYRLAGKDNAVAAMGVGLGAENLEKLTRRASEVIICLDGDDAGRRSMMKRLPDLLSLIDSTTQIRICELPDGADPDDYIKQHGLEAFEKYAGTQPTIDAYVAQVIRGLDDGSLHAKAKMVSEVARYASAITDDIFRELLVTHMASELGLAPEKIMRAVEGSQMDRSVRSRQDTRQSATEPSVVSMQRPLANEAPTATVPAKPISRDMGHFVRRTADVNKQHKPITPEQMFRENHRNTLREFRALEKPTSADVKVFVERVLQYEASFKKSELQFNQTFDLINRVLSQQIGKVMNDQARQQYATKANRMVAEAENREITHGSDIMDMNHTKPVAKPAVAQLEQASAPGRS